MSVVSGAGLSRCSSTLAKTFAPSAGRQKQELESPSNLAMIDEPRQLQSKGSHRFPSPQSATVAATQLRLSVFERQYRGDDDRANPVLNVWKALSQ